MIKRVLLLLLVAVLVVPAVSANGIIYDEDLFEFVDTSSSGVQGFSTYGYGDIWQGIRHIVFKDITKASVLDFLVFELPEDGAKWLNGTRINDGRYDFVYHFNGADRPGVLYLNRKSDGWVQFTVSLKDWDIGDLKGKQVIEMPFYFVNSGTIEPGTVTTDTNTYICYVSGNTEYCKAYSYKYRIKVTEKTAIMWKHHLRVTADANSYHIDINGFIDGHRYTSEVALKKGAEIYSKFTNPGEAMHRSVLKSEIDLIEITSPSQRRYDYPLFGDIPSYPLRTVTVTMRDINGNTISGFEVRAENAYTGESYFASTVSDVAYITLPMDRIATVPNPETGEYEEAPVGYYNFYGIKSGYKMVPDWAIRVNVLPEKYLPDVFCEFIVAPVSSSPGGPDLYPVTVYVYDAETRLPLSGDWDYYIVIQDSESVSGSASGASAVVYLPATSILQPHLLYVTKDGYEMVPGFVAFDVPVGGREIHVYLTPLEIEAPDGSSVVTFVVTDIETGTPVRNCLVNVDGKGKFAGASGTVLFVLPENSEHQWVATADGYWPIGGNFTLGEDDLTIPVEMTKKTSDLPRPPLPDLPNLPVVPPGLDPASFRMLILNVPYLGDMAEPLLDVIDAIAAGVDDIASSVLDFLTAPADLIVRAMQGISSQLVSVSKVFLDAAGIVLDSLGMLIAAIPTKVINLVTFAMVLDIIILLLRGGL